MQGMFLDGRVTLLSPSRVWVDARVLQLLQTRQTPSRGAPASFDVICGGGCGQAYYCPGAGSLLLCAMSASFGHTRRPPTLAGFHKIVHMCSLCKLSSGLCSQHQIWDHGIGRRKKPKSNLVRTRFLHFLTLCMTGQIRKSC